MNSLINATKKHSLWLCFFVCLSIMVPAHGWDYAVGPSYHFFHYHETDDNNRTLNRETGYLYGIENRLLSNKSSYQFSLYLNWLAGRVDYKGKTQVGSNLTTHTDQRIFRYGVSYESGPFSETVPVLIETSLEGNSWRRDILPIGNVSRLTEDYHWVLWKLGLGYAVKNQSWSIGMNQQFSAYMDIHSTSCTNTIRVFPKPEHGWYLAWRRKQNSFYGYDASWSMAFETWGMKRSDNVQTTYCGIPISVHEPDNQTQLLSVSYRLHF